MQKGQRLGKIRGAKAWSTVKSAYKRAASAIPQETFEEHSNHCASYQGGRFCRVCEQLFEDKADYQRDYTTGTTDMAPRNALQEHLALQAEE
jgi:hypothetical protein